MRLAGEEIAGAPTDRIARRGVGLVPQGRRVFAPLTVSEHLAIAARRGRGAWDRDRVLELLPRLGERLGHRGDQLSGRAQMLAIARALLTNPRLLLLDYALEHRGMFELMFRHDLLDSEKHPSDQSQLRDSTLPMFELMVELVVRLRTEQAAERHPGAPRDPAPPPAVTAAALWSNLHGLAQLWAWGSLQLALNAVPPGGASDDSHLDQLVAAVLDAHLGPVTS